jgi:DNA-binding SARP family transcriptional activator
MTTLHLFGGARLTGENGRLTGEPAQRHRVALLAVLAAASETRVPREKLMALLWPDHGQREARHLLNVSVHVLRRALGDDIIRTQGNDLTLNTDTVACDLVQFRAALARGELREATELYAGPFLDGFFLDAAPEFERWQDAERKRLAAEFAAALESRAEQAEKEGETGEALECWRRLVHHEPANVRVTLKLMRALEAAGDRAGALQAADAHMKLLAEEFGAEPSPEVLELGARIRERPQGSARGSEARAAPAAGAPVVAKTEGGTGPRRRLVNLAVVGGLGTAAVLTLTVFAPWKSASPPATSVAVLPFVDLSPSGDQAYLSDGLTEELLNALARIPGLLVAARSSSFQYRDPGVDVRRVGRELQVAAVVEGSVRQDRRRQRLSPVVESVRP